MMENEESLWGLVDRLDRSLRATIREMAEPGVNLQDAVRPVVGHRSCGQEQKDQYWVLSEDSSEARSDAKFVQQNESSPMPKLWGKNASNFRAVIDHLFNGKDQEILAYFAILLKLDHEVLGKAGGNFTFAAFDKNPKRAGEDLFSYAFGPHALPSTEVLFGQPSRAPLCFWAAPDLKIAKAMQEQYSGTIPGAHYCATCMEGVYYFAPGDQERLVKAIGNTSRGKAILGREIESVRKTFAAYWRHITGSDDKDVISIAMAKNCFGAIFIPVSSNNDESAGAVFLLFSDYKVPQFRNKIGINFNARKALAAALIIRGPFDSWQDRLEENSNTSIETRTQITGMLGHEVKNLAEAVGGRWSIPYASRPRSTPDSISKSWRIIQFPDLYIYAQRLLKLWAMTCSPEDLPLTEVHSLEDLMGVAMQRAVESWAIEQTIDAPDQESISDILHFAKSVNCRDCFEFRGPALAEVNWPAVECGTRITLRQFLGIYRIFVAVAEDFIKFHGFRNSRLCISLSSTESVQARVKIQFRSPIAPTRVEKANAPFSFGIAGSDLLKHLCAQLLNESPTLHAEVFTPSDGGKSDGEFEQTVEMNCPTWIKVKEWEVP